MHTDAVKNRRHFAQDEGALFGPCAGVSGNLTSFLHCNILIPQSFRPLAPMISIVDGLCN